MKKNYLKGISLIDAAEDKTEITEAEPVDEINHSQFFITANRKNQKTNEPDATKIEK